MEKLTIRQQVIQDLIDKKVRLSYSTLKKFTSPISIVNYLVEKRTKVFIPTDSMVMGSLCDLLLFTPDELDKRFVVANNIPTTDAMKNYSNELIMFGKEGNEINEDVAETVFFNHYKRGSAPNTWEKLKDFIHAKIDGKDITTPQLKQEAEDLIGALKQHNEVDELLSQMIETQKKIQFQYDGWNYIGYYDAFMEGNNVLDGKFSKDANPEKFERDIYNMEYFLQAGIYTDYLIQEGINLFPNYSFLVYDKSFNYSIIKMDRKYIEYGIAKYQHLTQKLSQLSKYKRFGGSYDFFKKEFIAYKPNWSKGFDLDGGKISNKIEL